MEVIKEACEEMKELLHEAKEHIRMAIYNKEDYPILATTYAEIANQELAQADRIHNAVIAIIEKYKTSEKDIPQTMLDLWKYEHKLYIDKVEKVRYKIQMYQKY